MKEVVVVGVLMLSACDSDTSIVRDRHSCVDEDAGESSGESPDAGFGSDSGSDDGASSESGLLEGSTGENDDLAELSDEFEQPNLDPSWTVFNPGESDRIEMVGGQLTVEPSSHSLWYNGVQGTQIFKTIDGDFAVTARVRVSTISGVDWSAIANWQLGGISLREPGNAVNAVHLVLGRTNHAQAQWEPKNTVDSFSTWSDGIWPGGEGELRLCRSGSMVTASIREGGMDPWGIVGQWSRDDLGDTLLVGPIGYASTGNPDLRVEYEWIEFERVEGC
ncbi:MAG: hypothetical protein AAGF11_33530 [Myxococcota bacterium]